LIVFVLTGVATTMSVGQSGDGWVLVGGGHVGRHHWRDEVVPRGARGVCLEVTVFARHLSRGNGVGQCSAPSPRRGIVLAAVEPHFRSGRPAITAVGAAFNRTVRRVEVVLFSGESEDLPLHSIGGPKEMMRYRFVAFAQRGPWCVARLRTFDHSGEILWETNWREISMEASELSYKPSLICPRSSG
jgi:hypothetical protein